MKKLFFVLAFVTVYGVSMAANSQIINHSDNQQTVIIAQTDDNQLTAVDSEKEKESKTAATDAKTKAKTETKADTKAKSEGCSGEAKKECGSGCGEKKD